MIVFYRFSKFLHNILCFWGQGIHCRHSFWATISGDLENAGQLPVHEVLEGTYDCVLQIFKISSLYMFLRPRNPLPTFLLSYNVRLTSKIQVNFRYRRNSKVLMIVSHWFSKFLHYICFSGQGIHCRHSYWATIFGRPRKSRSTSGTGGTRRYWWLCLINFWYSFTVYVFKVRKYIADILTELPYSSYFESLGQLPVQEVLIGADDFVFRIFTISSVLFMFLRSRFSLLAFLLGYHIWMTSNIPAGQPSAHMSCFLWVTSQTFRTGSCFGFSRSSKHSSSVYIYIYIYIYQIMIFWPLKHIYWRYCENPKYTIISTSENLFNRM